MVAGRTWLIFVRDENGGAMVETLVVINLLILVLVLFIEFGMALNQWNLAAKSVQVGARLAAVSDPVDSDLTTWDGLVTDSVLPGDPIDPAQSTFDTTCDGSAETCDGTYDSDAMMQIVYGSGWDSDPPDCSASGTRLGMCDVLPSIEPENVRIRYEFTGLGYAGRPGGPVPTVTVWLTGLTFDFLLLGDLLGLDNIELPAFTVTIVGEDLSTTY